MGSSTYEADSKADLTAPTNTTNTATTTTTTASKSKTKFNQFNKNHRSKSVFRSGFSCFADDTVAADKNVTEQKVDIELDDDYESSSGFCSCKKCCFCGCADFISSQRKISSCNSTYDNEPTRGPAVAATTTPI